MTTLDQITRTGQMVLARLLVPANGGLTAAKVAADLSKMDAERFSAENVAAELEELRSRGHVEAALPPPAPVRKTASIKRPSNKPTAPPKPPRYILTSVGQGIALRATGLEKLPSKPTWPKIIEQLLRVAVDATQQTPPLKTKAALAAYLIRRQFDLDVPENAKLPAVIVSTVCKTLGFPGVSDYKVLEAKVLEKMIGATDELTPQDAAEQFIRSRLGSKQGKPDEIRMSALRQWLAEEGAQVETKPSARQDTSARHETGRPSLEDFARHAVDAARRSDTGWFGDNKVFINHSWKSYLVHGDGQTGLDLPQFKQQLIRANTAGLLELSRADLVALMDPTDVRESEAHYLNTSFHFILIERGRL